MTYNIRYLSLYIRSLKVCNVRYILSYKHQNMELYTRNAVNYSFLLSCIDRMLNYDLKSQQIVLHTNLQSKMVLTIFTIFFGGGGGGNHIQQLIILKVIITETRCLQF